MVSHSPQPSTDSTDAGRTLHLLLVTVEDPHDPRSWSGTPFHMRTALEQKFARVTVLSSRKPKRSLVNAALRMLLGKNRYPLWMTRAALKDYALRLDTAIARERPDAVLCLSSQHLVYAKATGVPTYMVSDAPWMAYKQAYKDYDALPLLATHFARLEAAAARRISGVVYPTPWACSEAVQRFDLPADRVDCIPFGANRYCAESSAQVLERLRHKSSACLDFLFVGKDWERKGGPLAVQIVRQLNQSGCPARLVIIGCTPVIDPQDAPHVLVQGFLSPASATDQQAMQAAYEQAHFFLVPSRAECFGLVFAEAQSYGLPCIALNSQGIPGVVDSGVTGLLFAADEALPVIVNQVRALAGNRAAYQAMATAARLKFDHVLNWSAFAMRTHHKLVDACNAAKALRAEWGS